MRAFRSWLSLYYLQFILQLGMNKNRGQPWTTGIGTGAHEGWWRWKAENRAKGKKYRTDGEGRRQGDGIDNREKESEIVEGCEGWVVKAPKVKSNEDLRADCRADAGKCPRMLFLPIYNVNSILKCCLMESLQLHPSLNDGRVQRLSVSHVWAEFVCFFLRFSPPAALKHTEEVDQ